MALILQAHGATFSQQSLLSFISYPYIFKILLAPLIDGIYISNVGRSKTWIMISGFAMALFLFGVAFECEGMMKRLEIVKLLVIWFSMNVLNCFFVRGF